MPNQHPQGVAPQRRNIQNYHKQHWTFDETVVARLSLELEQPMVVCPACRKTDVKDPGGVVTLTGGFWYGYRDEMLSLVRNEEKGAIAVNALERLIDIVPEGEDLRIRTTNEKLAERIGRALRGAYDGEVEYKWLADNMVVRVTWSRAS